MRPIVILLIVLLFSFGCSQQRSDINQQQQNFVFFLESKDSQSKNLTNEIEEHEFYKSFDKELSNYLDSVRLFLNWKGVIDDIKIDDMGSFTEVSFKLNFKPSETTEITFYCEYPVNKTNTSYDALYNDLKKISNGATVYFDGFIKRDWDNNVMYKNDSKIGTMKLSYPMYMFNALRVSQTKGVDSLSETMKAAVDKEFGIIELAKARASNAITDAEFANQIKKQDFELTQAKLSKAEWMCCKDIRRYLVIDFFKE